MRVNCLWAALAVPMVFDLVCNSRGEFIAAFCAIAALVFGIVVGVAEHSCCWVIFFRRCAGLFVATGMLDMVEGADCNLVRCVLLNCSVFGTLGGNAMGCTLKAVASLFWMGTLRSDLDTDEASISCVRLRISCS